MANRRLEAFKEGFNIAGLATAAAASAALVFSPVPLLVAVVAEAAYLLFVPDSRWYDTRLARREDAAVLKRRAELKSQVLPALSPATRARFAHLEAVRARLDGLGAKSDQEGKWYREILRKLDFLLEKFLQFAAKEAGFRSYIEGVLHEAGVALPASAPIPISKSVSLSAGALQSGLGSKRKPHTLSVPSASRSFSSHGRWQPSGEYAAAPRAPKHDYCAGSRIGRARHWRGVGARSDAPRYRSLRPRR